MKLAEALADRSDCQKKIEKLKERLVNCARVQAGEKPIEDPKALLCDRRFLGGTVPPRRWQLPPLSRVWAVPATSVAPHYRSSSSASTPRIAKPAAKTCA